MLHIPILRAGTPYQSLNRFEVNHFISGEPLATVSLANPGLIARDLNQMAASQRSLAELGIPRLIAVCREAAALFLRESLPIGDQMQSKTDYIHQVSATTGMPEVMCENNMHKIATALEKMEEVLAGLTRGLPLENLHLAFRRETLSLGAVLPNNSPGVHSLWLPAIALQIPVVLKPGSREPWTPYRIVQALIRAGCPKDAFFYYPTDPNGAREILLRCGKSMFFGDKNTVAGWGGGDIQIHGPGWSKVIVGEDKADDYESFLDLMVTSVAANGGRSCINASGIWSAARGRELAEALAQRLAAIPARAMDDPQAQISAFTNVRLAEMLDRKIESQIAQGGAEDLTARYRDGGRLVTLDGATFLLPTLVWCEDADHPLAQAEYLFPFCTAVQASQAEIPDRIGATLVATVLSEDEAFIQHLVSSRQVDRINVGPIPTVKIRWDQPHEGNLFELLYKQRAVQYQSF